MSPTLSPSLLLTTIIFTLFSHLHHLSSAAHLHAPQATATCGDTCGSIPIKYPFGTGLGCGHPSFSSYVRCTAGTLQLTTTTGLYTITSIDYTTSTLILTDPLMSNCTSMQNSGSFGLDRAAPFEVTSADTFVLMGCSTTSPLFDQNQDLCDSGSGSRICKGVYSCKGVRGIGFAVNAPVSTCCVYQYYSGLMLGGFSIDLPKLQCASYTCVYGFGGDEGDPSKWSYGVELQFNSSYRGDGGCSDCEGSGGMCGFDVMDERFLCVCGNRVNTSTNCYGQGYAWSGAWRHYNYMGMKKRIQGLLFLLLMKML